MLFPWGTAFFNSKRHNMSPMSDLDASSRVCVSSALPPDLTKLTSSFLASNNHKKTTAETFLRHLCSLIQIIIGYREVTRNLHKTSRFFRDFVSQLDGAMELLHGLGFEDVGDKMIPPTEQQYQLRQFMRLDEIAPFLDEQADGSTTDEVQRQPSLSNSATTGNTVSPVRQAVGATKYVRVTPRTANGTLNSPRNTRTNSVETIDVRVNRVLTDENKKLHRRLGDLQSQIDQVINLNDQLEQENKEQIVAAAQWEHQKQKWENMTEEVLDLKRRNSSLSTECNKLREAISRDRQWYMMGLVGNMKPTAHHQLCVSGAGGGYDSDGAGDSIVYPHSFDHGTLVEEDDELEDELHGHSAGSLERRRSKDAKRVDDRVGATTGTAEGTTNKPNVFSELQQEILNGWRKARQRNRELQAQTDVFRERVQQLEKMIVKLKKARRMAEKRAKTLSDANADLRLRKRQQDQEQESQQQQQLPPSSDDSIPPCQQSPVVSRLTVSLRKQREQQEDEAAANQAMEEGEMSSRYAKQRRTKRWSKRQRRSSDSTGDEDLEIEEKKLVTRGGIPADLIQKSSRTRRKTKAKMGTRSRSKTKGKAQQQQHPKKRKTNHQQHGDDDLFYVDVPSAKKSEVDPFTPRERDQEVIETHGRLLSKLLRKDELLHHERNKNRELRNTVTEVQRRSLDVNQHQCPLLIGSLPRSSSDRTDDLEFERDCVCRVFGGHDENDSGAIEQRLSVCVRRGDENSVRDVWGFVVGCDDDNMPRGEIVKRLTKNCLHGDGRTSLLCVCVSDANFFGGGSSTTTRLSRQLIGLVNKVLDKLCVGDLTKVTVKRLDCVARGLRRRLLLSECGNEVSDLESLLNKLNDESVCVSDRVVVVSMYLECGGVMHVLCTNLPYSDFLFMPRGRDVLELLKNYVPSTVGLFGVGDADCVSDEGVVVAVASHVDYTERPVN